MTNVQITNPTAEGWVAEAIACGADPRIIQQPSGSSWPGRFGLIMKVADVDWTAYPDRLPEELKADVFRILDDMGRVVRVGR